MDKFIKNAAIYLVVRSEREDNNYFISQKIEKMKQCCKRKDIEVNNIFIFYENGRVDVFKRQWKHLKEQIKKEQIQVLIIENTETILQLEDVEVEKICMYK